MTRGRITQISKGLLELSDLTSESPESRAGATNPVPKALKNNVQIVLSSMSRQDKINLPKKTRIIFPDACHHLKTPSILGSIVEWNAKKKTLKVLTWNQLGGSFPVSTKHQTLRRRNNLLVRNLTLNSIDRFFIRRKFTRVRTPIVVKSPGMEPHIKPFQVSTGAFLHTSPEFAMKKLLVQGYEKIFQVCPVFRNEPCSNTHHPEFTMLEWYRAYEPLDSIMKDTESLVRFVARATQRFRPRSSIDFRSPFLKFTVAELFKKHIHVELPSNDDLSGIQKIAAKLRVPGQIGTRWDDVFFSIWLNFIEPNFSKNRPMFVTEFPKSQAALSKLKVDRRGELVADRFELYISGQEIANAFYELTDPDLQHSRFLEDQKIRKQVYGDAFPESPIDENFISALKEGMPPSSGIALGVDRLIMVMSGENILEETLPLTSYHPVGEALPP